MLVCVSPNGGVEYAGPQPLGAIKVATIDGVHTFQREPGATQWRRGPASLQGIHVGALLYEPASGALFAGAHADGGLWRNKDGETWERLSFPMTHIYSVQAQKRKQGVRLWVGTEPVGLFFSDDLGDTWTECEALKRVPEHENWTFPSPPNIGHVKGLAWHDSDPDRIYVMVEQGGLYLSKDAGKSFTELKGYLIGHQEMYRDAHRICIPPSNPNLLFFATGDGLCRSFDGGETWTYLMPRGPGRIGYPDAMFIDPHNEKMVVVGGPRLGPELWCKTAHSESTVLVSYDGGDTWVDKGADLGAPVKGNIEAMGCYATPSGSTYLVGTATGQLFISENACDSWTLIADDLPPISKAGHYRWFLSESERHAVEARMRRWSQTAA
ncbi:MAG: hypothetical protein JNJ73_06200 [Hyphomonadaceae bacterium]|nr:hypothetical protein [Hyphomonadaceae bacterium]